MQLRNVHSFEVRGLSRKKQTSRVRSSDKLESAVRACDSIRARISRETLRTGCVAVRGRARAGRLYVVVACDGAHERRLGRRPTRMQSTAMTLRAGAVEDCLPQLLQLVQFWIRIAERRRAGEDLIGEHFDAGRREQRLLKSREVI